MEIDEKKKLKYQTYIDKVVSEGTVLPELMVPEDKLAYRFVFSDNPEKNHIPVCVMNPKRILPNDVKKSDGLITLEAECTSHFDFYEFEDCNPAALFTTKKQFV